MLTVDEALEQVLAHVATNSPVRMPTSSVSGLVLAEEIVSDVDSPPHDKSIVDGYAIVAADFAARVEEFNVIEEVTAGAVPKRAVTPGNATRIMTGAPLPEGASAVVMVEQSEFLPTPITEGLLGRVRLTAERVVPGQNIMTRAASMTRGDRILSAGHFLRPIEIGVLAEVGQTEVLVLPRPQVAVLATGDELVPSALQPGPGHIRNSNGPMLVAAAQAAGGIAIDLGIARDNEESLRALIGQGLKSDVLIISGGVSAGVLDLVPGVLQSLGVRQVFHKVQVKPGKPLWFGVRSSEGALNGEWGTLVFGLPGNPVSSLVCFELFVRPALAKLAGRQCCGHDETSALLTADFEHRGERPTYHPGILTTSAGVTTIEPIRWRGSGDLAALVAANALIAFPPGNRKHASGEPVRVLRLAGSTF